MKQLKLGSFSAENALELMIAFDENGVINYANRMAKEQLEYTDDICGVHISVIFPSLFERTDEGFTMTGEMGEGLYETMAYRKNQTCFQAEARFVRDETRSIYIGMVNNVSKRVYLEKKITQVEQEAKEAMKVKSVFVANVTHELRTPVNGILGNVQELARQEEDADRLQILNLIERGCRDMNNIINNILDFSKLEAGKFTLEPREFHFRNMIDYVKKNHIHKITEKGLEFFVTISPEIPEYIIGDELRIVQILNNLLSNAYKFTAVGKIAVEVLKTAQIGNRVELFFLVIDSGIGIDKSQEEKLFKSFSQVDASISRKYGGTGLGLNICKQLVELMGGNISVESEKGKGSMFSFSIWVELTEKELEKSTETVDINAVAGEVQSIRKERNHTDDSVHQYGTPKNKEEIEKQMSRFILSVEMGNWEKAEMFMDVIKQLMKDAPREVKNAVLKLKMSAQKENYDKTTAAFEALQGLL